MKGRAVIAVCAAALGLAVAVVAQYGAPPSLADRRASTAIFNTEDTRLGRVISPHGRRASWAFRHLYTLPDARDAFAARSLLAQTAERTLDIRYYIWRGRCFRHTVARCSARRGGSRCVVACGCCWTTTTPSGSTRFSPRSIHIPTSRSGSSIRLSFDAALVGLCNRFLPAQSGACMTNRSLPTIKRGNRWRAATSGTNTSERRMAYCLRISDVMLTIGPVVTEVAGISIDIGQAHRAYPSGELAVGGRMHRSDCQA